VVTVAAAPLERLPGPGTASTLQVSAQEAADLFPAGQGAESKDLLGSDLRPRPETCRQAAQGCILPEAAQNSTHTLSYP
jgi:hypothetical protein